MTDNQRKALIQTLKYLDHIADSTGDGYDWREACGLIKSIEENFGFSIVDYNPEKVVNQLRTMRLGGNLTIEVQNW